MNFRNSFTFIKIYIVLLFFISNIISAQSDSTLIINMYDDFQTTVKSKDVTGHSNLLLTPFMPVNIINKSPQGPTINYINAQSWISFFSQPRPYELVISDIDVKLENNIAITIANFKEYINENYSAFGTDVFSYVKTNDGWKYNTFNNTVVLSSDQNDYEEAFTFNNKPEDIPDLFTASINQKNRTNFTNLFTSNFAHFISVDGTLNESFSTAKHSANAFINSVINNSSNIEFELNNYKIEIHDQYVASIIGDYSIKENNELSESGRIILVLNASRAANWKINVVLKSPGSSVTAVDDKSEIVENSFKTRTKLSKSI